ncbi:response regulator [Allohahella sp. A8]|uniref:response regulator n=1 Tax=Allohahella sp. A8 TaxID=3141461 RepID=UPI003A807C54
MIEAATPSNEAERLEALHCLALMDSDAEHRFDHIVNQARELFDVPIAIITLLDSERQWFKAKSGLKITETARNISFCSHALASDEPLVVEDALQDARFMNNPLVTGEIRIRFYAGYPIRSPDGYPLGTLCIIDHSPRAFGDSELKLLQHLAQLVDKEIAATPLPNATLLDHSHDRFGDFLQNVGSLISRKPIALAIATGIFFAIFIACSRYYIHTLEANYAEDIAKTSSRLSNIRGRLETELNARLHLTHGLAGLVRAGRDDIDREGFLSFAQDLGKSLTGIRSLQLAPNGVVSYLWPEATNSPALGHDLLADPNRRMVATKAIQTGEMWIAGPLELLQGGTALIGRLPVFVDNRNSEERNASDKFWGFATVLIDLDSLLNVSDFYRLSKNFSVAIRGRNGLGSKGDIFFGSEAVFKGEHLSASVSLPAGRWEIGMTVPTPPTFHVISPGMWGLITASALLIAALLYLLLRLPYRYQRAVDLAKHALQKSNARFRDAIEALPDGFSVFDEYDRLVSCNRKYRDFFAREHCPISLGVTFENLIRESIETGIYRLSDGDPQSRDEMYAQRIAYHRNPAPEGLELELSDGRWLRAIESRVPSGGSIIAYTDVSELKKKEHELASEKRRAESANEAKTAFLATVSHELRTPLNAILGMVNLMQLSGRLQSKDQEYIDLTHDSAEHLLNLLNELLDLSKMEANKLELEYNEFNLAVIARKALKLCQSKADQKNIALIGNIDSESEVMVKGDAGRLQQILLNLLSNALKFTDHGSVTLSVIKEKALSSELQFQFRIEDTGIGFSGAQADTLFQPFLQLDSTASRKHEGTGLGLAICKRLTELMGGSIVAEGRPGDGAIFELTIPFEAGDATNQQDSIDEACELTPAELEHHPVRVLIAEDSPANQIVFRAMLENTGYYADVVGNGLEALQAAKDFGYDIILMDIFMPEMDGIKATRAIREESAIQSTPIIALTANAMPGDQEKFLNAGMDDYIAKPLNKKALIKMLNKWAFRATC